LAQAKNVGSPTWRKRRGGNETESKCIDTIFPLNYKPTRP